MVDRITPSVGFTVQQTASPTPSPVLARRLVKEIDKDACDDAGGESRPIRAQDLSSTTNLLVKPEPDADADIAAPSQREAIHSTTEEFGLPASDQPVGESVNCTLASAVFAAEGKQC